MNQMKKILANNYLLLLGRLFLGFVFLYAAIEKISDPESFAIAINNYKLLPIFSINIFAIILPWIELTAGLLLIFGIAIKENSLIISALLTLFIIVISISLFRGLDINCGCFGTVNGTKIGVQKIVENALLILVGLHLVYHGGGTFSLQYFIEKE
jgi:putative oxidoreductase